MRKYLLITGFISCLFLNACHRSDVDYVSSSGEINNEIQVENGLETSKEESIKWEEDIQKGNGKLSVNVNIDNKDINHIPVYTARKKTIDVNDEKRIASEIFDEGTCKEYHDNFDYLFYDLYLSFMDLKGTDEKFDFFSGENPVTGPDGTKNINGWYDTSNGYWHTYSGFYNGRIYCLLFATDIEKNITKVLFFPDATYSKYEKISDTEGGIFSDYLQYNDEFKRDPDTPGLKEMAEIAQTFASHFGFDEKVETSSPQYKNLYEDMSLGDATLRIEGEEITAKPFIMQDNNELLLPRYITYENSHGVNEEADGQYNEDETYIDWDQIFTNDMLINTGRLLVEEDHVVWAELKFTYGEISTQTESTSIMSFDKVKEAFISTYKDNALFSNEAVADKISLVYYPVVNPDDTDEFSWIPCYVMYIDRNTMYEKRIIINAIDCSLVEVDGE